MARSHGRIKVEIWGNDDFRQLTCTAQRAYFMLISQQLITNCGVQPYTPRRWAALAADSTTESIEADIAELAAARYVIIDHDTEELLIRTYVEHDGIIGSPNMEKAAKNEFAGIISPLLRQTLREGFPELFPKGLPEPIPEGFPSARAPALPAPPPYGETSDSVIAKEEVSREVSPPERARDREPDADAPLALAGSRSAPAHTDKKPKATGWRRTRGSHGELWKRDPQGTDKPPREVTQTWHETQERPEEATTDNQEIDPEGLRRIRDLMTTAAGIENDGLTRQERLEQTHLEEMASPEAEERRQASIAALEKLRRNQNNNGR